MGAFVRLLAAAALLLAACSGPCDDLDAQCERRCNGESVGHCKYLVTKLSDSACEELMTLAQDQCPLDAPRAWEIDPR